MDASSCFWCLQLFGQALTKLQIAQRRLASRQIVQDGKHQRGLTGESKRDILVCVSKRPIKIQKGIL